MTTMLLPLRPGKNASNVNDPTYTSLAQASQTDTPSANQALAKYLMDQAWILAVARAKHPVPVASNVNGVSLDSNGYLDLVNAAAS